MKPKRPRHAFVPTTRAGIMKCKHCGSLRRETFASSRRGAARVVLYDAVGPAGSTWADTRMRRYWLTIKPNCWRAR